MCDTVAYEIADLAANDAESKARESERARESDQQQQESERQRRKRSSENLVRSRGVWRFREIPKEVLALFSFSFVVSIVLVRSFVRSLVGAWCGAVALS